MSLKVHATCVRASPWVIEMITNHNQVRLGSAPALASISAMVGCASHNRSSMNTLAPATMPRIATIEERYQSYDVEMLEVTGGKFWKPYGPELNALLKQPAPGAASSSSGDTPAGMNPGLYQYRPPIDLSNARLRKLAAALGPAYVRVSGTWANSVYFQESPQGPSAETRPQDDNAKQEQHQNQQQGHNANDANSHQPKPGDAPAGFNGVLTREEWKGVIDFAHAVNGEIVTSFATSVGTRDAYGVWTPEQARQLLDF